MVIKKQMEERIRIQKQSALQNIIFVEIQPIVEQIKCRILQSEAANPQVKRKYLYEISLLSTYIKRKTNLILMAQTQSTISTEEIAPCFYESFQNLEFCGSICYLHIVQNQEMEMEMGILTYDLFEKVLEKVSYCPKEVFINYDVIGNQINFSIRVSANHSENMMDIVCFEKNKLAEKGMCINVEKEEDGYYIAVATLDESLLLSNCTFNKLSHDVTNGKLQNEEEHLDDLIALNMRVHFHDNFGNLTTLTKTYLTQDIGIEKTEELLALWEKFINLLDICAIKHYEKALELNQIEDLAIKLGCELFIVGEFPEEETAKQLMLLAINEMLKNAVYHASANQLYVSLKATGIEYSLEIQNINTHKISKLKEGGGLSGLRKKIEQAKGHFSIEVGENIVLRLILPQK